MQSIEIFLYGTQFEALRKLSLTEENHDSLSYIATTVTLWLMH